LASVTVRCFQLGDRLGIALVSINDSLILTWCGVKIGRGNRDRVNLSWRSILTRLLSGFGSRRDVRHRFDWFVGVKVVTPKLGKVRRRVFAAFYFTTRVSRDFI
jgi:hypothetical protein